MTLHGHGSDLVAAYVAGALDGADLDAFELHLLTCDECRRAIRVGIAARSALLTAPVRVPAAPGRWLRWTGVGLAAAAALAIFVLREDAGLDPLSAVAPPQFVAGAIRSPADSAAALVDRGMAAYAASDYGMAVEFLARAARADSSAGVSFYLGVSFLMVGDNVRAHAALLGALDPPGNPYADEAVYYAMKALVRSELPDSALSLLRFAVGSGPMANRVRAFGDSISRR